MAANFRATDAEPSANRPASVSRRIDKRYGTGPYSRALDRGAVGGLNGNSAEAKFIKAYEAMLVEHVGGAPSIVQRQIISRCARLACHLELWDRQTIPNGGAVSATGHNHYIQWSNCLARTLARLSLQPAAKTDPGAPLREHLARLAAAGRGEAA